MGASLFLTVGPVNIGEIFGSGGSDVNAAEPYEEQAERIEVRLKKEPDEPRPPALADPRPDQRRQRRGDDRTERTRAYSTEAVQAYQEADQSWSEYLKATKEPNPGLAQLVAPMMITLAELSTSYPQADQRIQAAAEAQRIVAEDRPTMNSLSTLAFYTYFTGDFPAAEKARAEAKQLAKTKAEREEIDKAARRIQEKRHRYVAAKAKAEKEQKAAGGSGSPESLENPLSPGGLGGGGLGE